MTITILTLFPEIIKAYFSNSIMARCVERGTITYNIVNFRDYALDKHKSVDDQTFGGGAGQLLMADPIDRAMKSYGKTDLIYATPAGVKFTQDIARDLSKESDLTFLCGRYEGVDQRVLDKYNARELSVGDYVLSSGEVATLTIIDTVYRLIPGVISGESLEEESFSIIGEDGKRLLEYPQWTKPAVWDGREVPPVLLSGNHKKIKEWRHEASLLRTKERRPDLL